jgi:hypothetical protein
LLEHDRHFIASTVAPVPDADRGYSCVTGLTNAGGAEHKRLARAQALRGNRWLVSAARGNRNKLDQIFAFRQRVGVRATNDCFTESGGEWRG